MFFSVGPTRWRDTVTAVMMAWGVSWIHPPPAPCRRSNLSVLWQKKGNENVVIDSRGHVAMGRNWFDSLLLNKRRVHWFIHGGVVVCVPLLSHGAREACCNYSRAVHWKWGHLTTIMSLFSLLSQPAHVQWKGLRDTALVCVYESSVHAHKQTTRKTQTKGAPCTHLCTYVHTHTSAQNIEDNMARTQHSKICITVFNAHR